MDRSKGKSNGLLKGEVMEALEGIVTVLRSLDEAQDAIEPAALAAGGDALEVMTGAWRTAFAATHRNPTR